MSKKAKKHGGARPGAGRKPVHPEGQTMIIGVSVPIQLMNSLDALAESKGWSRSHAITEAIRQLVKDKK